MHSVTIKPFKLSKYEITFDQYDAYANSVGGGDLPDDRGWGRGNRPVIDVSWDDIQAYISWLNQQTGKQYRLPSEAEWEYAARAGSQTEYSWGKHIGDNQANCDGCGSGWDKRQTAPVGAFQSNAFGLYDMHGNVWEWVQDCYHDSYRGAPTDGSVWLGDDCGDRRVLRGGSWGGKPENLRSAERLRFTPADRDGNIGFRLAHDRCPPGKGEARGG